MARLWLSDPQVWRAVLVGHNGCTPLFNLVFLSLYHLGGATNPVPYYCYLLLAHFLVSLAVYWLGATLLNRRAALLGAVGFALFWGNHQAVTWIGAGHRPLCSFLVICSIVLFLRFRREGRRSFLAWAAVLGFLAMLSKEDAIVLLPLVFLADCLALQRWPWKGRNWAAYLPLAAACLLYALIQPLTRGTGTSFSGLTEGFYWFGPHMFRNLLDIVPQLLVPDIARGGFREALQGALTVRLADLVGPCGHLMRLVFTLAALDLLIRGTDPVRYLVAGMYVAFLPFTAFTYEYAVAARYRYLSAAGFALLLGYGVCVLSTRLAQRSWPRALLWGLTGLVLLANLGLLWRLEAHLQRDAEARQAVLTEVQRVLPEVPPRTVFRFEGLPGNVEDTVMAVSLLYDVPTWGVRPRDAGDATCVVHFEGLHISGVQHLSRPQPPAPPFPAAARWWDSR
ncbi:hypothetical protein LLH03_07185 [bacterium]|nr:hypothetical protein [bacterium]